MPRITIAPAAPLLAMTLFVAALLAATTGGVAAQPAPGGSPAQAAAPAPAGAGAPGTAVPSVSPPGSPPPSAPAVPALAGTPALAGAPVPPGAPAVPAPSAGPPPPATPHPVPPPVTPPVPPLPAPPSTTRMQLSSVLGRTVIDPAGDSVGRIVDVLVDVSGQPRAAIIDYGGFMGLGSRRIAVAWDSISLPLTGPNVQVHLALTPDQIRSTPEYSGSGSTTVVVGPPSQAPTPGP